MVSSKFYKQSLKPASYIIHKGIIKEVKQTQYE